MCIDFSRRTCSGHNKNNSNNNGLNSVNSGIFNTKKKRRKNVRELILRNTANILLNIVDVYHIITGKLYDFKPSVSKKSASGQYINVTRISHVNQLNTFSWGGGVRKATFSSRTRLVKRLKRMRKKRNQ